uniref:DAO domain-containing protein n=1 Tax=Macrostomum lignano TaxID=282301 RepID=A0A1I8FTT2_9PLAT
RYHLHRPKSLADMSGSLPGVSIVKPLMGIDTFLEGNLESHFTFSYPKYEAAAVRSGRAGSVIGLVNNLRERFPNVDCRAVYCCRSSRNDSVHGMAAIVEKVAFGCNLGKQYLSLSQLGTHIFTGMSYLVRKPYLDKLVLSAFPAEQMVATASLPSYKDRMVRWWRLRLSMMPVVTLGAGAAD